MCPNRAYEVTSLLFMARSDSLEANAAAATELWESCGANLYRGAVLHLVLQLGASDWEGQKAAADALAAGLVEHPGAVSEALDAVVAQYDPGTFV
jgi:hypothetical protein